MFMATKKPVKAEIPKKEMSDLAKAEVELAKKEAAKKAEVDTYLAEAMSPEEEAAAKTKEINRLKTQLVTIERRRKELAQHLLSAHEADAKNLRDRLADNLDNRKKALAALDKLGVKVDDKYSPK
jgi:uncharacterized protein involved in exopolysaccharide biosynthesis